MYDDADLRFLATVANQVATVMDNALMRQEIISRLSHQTLLFMLSETFRRSMDLDEVMTSVVQILSNFLMIEHCGLAYFENEKTCRVYAVDLLSREAAEGLRARQQEVVRRLAAGGDAEASGFFMQGDRWPAPEGSTGPLAYLPLKERDEILGILIVSSRIGGKPIQPQEKDLLQAACAMLSQGVMLHRTIANLVNMKRYNESILNSINEMGDTLIIIDLEGRIQSVNQATCLLLGYGEEELVGRPIQQLVPQDEELFQAEGLRRLVRYGSITSYELEYIDRQGNRIPMLFSGSLMDTPGQRAERIVGIARDITEHKRAEDMQKNVVMVKEIHHRIKNNLQVISSLLFLQSSYVRDRRTREMFIESRNRVRSMALIHEKLYRSRDLRGIDFKGYMDDLVQNLLVSFGIDSSSLDLELNIQNVTLNMDTAIPCGLIVNELVSNSLKHAFPAESGGNRISIQLRTDVETGAEPAARRHAEKTVKRFELVVADNGRGLPDSLDFRATPSLGLKLVCTLTEQLNGTLQLDRTGGTTFRVRFQEI
jgi:PAS domain S-box-containing protein